MEDNFFSLVPRRLAEERKRLALKQAEAADLCGVRRESWGQYERGETAPGSQVLFHFAAAGADVAYILTGVRGGPSRLSPLEEALLANFRRCPERARDTVLDVADMLAQSGAKKE